ATDPTNIDLLGTVSGADGTNTGRNAKAWITIAPDWEGLPPDAQFALSVAGTTIATTPWARLLPEQILGAAGLPLASTTSRTVNLTYRASENGVILAQANFALTLGPADATTRAVHAPLVPAVVSGPTVPVTYDLRGARRLCAAGRSTAFPERLQARPLPRGPLRRLVPVVLGRLRNAGCRRGDVRGQRSRPGHLQRREPLQQSQRVAA